jgi:thiamine transport system substrate-binding protein
MMKRWWCVIVLAVVALAGCRAPEAPSLRVMTYGSFDISEAVIAEFEQEHEITVQFLDAGDTGQMVSQAILSRDNPEADVMYGIDNTFLSRAL